LSLDVTDSSLAPVATGARALFDSLRKKGIADCYFGRRVRGLVEQLGYLDVGQEGWTIMVRGGDPMARLCVEGWPIAAKPLVDVGLRALVGRDTNHGHSIPIREGLPKRRASWSDIDKTGKQAISRKRSTCSTPCSPR
jgi:hypothetical protein